MNLQEIGAQIRRSRLGRGLTQAQLAAAAHITRTTLNRLENGLLKDLGVRKVAALLDQVGLGLEVTDLSFESRKPNLLRQASISASVSFKEALSEEALEPVSYTHLDVYKRQVLGDGCSERSKEIARQLMQQSPGDGHRQLRFVLHVLSLIHI